MRKLDKTIIRAVERGVEPVIFVRARDSKGAQKSKIYLILGYILVFLEVEKCGISTNLGALRWSLDMNLRPRKDKKFHRGPNSFYRGPSTLFTALTIIIMLEAKRDLKKILREFLLFKLDLRRLLMVFPVFGIENIRIFRSVFCLILVLI